MVKTPYVVPSMAEIAALPWNGFNVVSTFSGGGGSCLGYRMAGYRVLWANEFIPLAQETYKANHPNSILDSRDIRKIEPSDILKATGLDVGAIDIFDGSPPCASFSTSGSREKGWGKEKTYSDTIQRTDDLFFEYARLIKGTQPKVFVAENVSGLVKGTAKGYFKEILAALKDCGYKVACRLLDAKHLGVPQSRQRVIFIGVRSDLGIEPAHPKPLSYVYTVGDAWARPMPIGKKIDCSNKAYGKYWAETRPGEAHHKRFNLKRLTFNRPSQTMTQTLAATIMHPEECRYPTIPEAKRLCSFPDDYHLAGTFAQQWERMGRAVPPVMMMQIAKTIEAEILCKIR